MTPPSPPPSPPDDTSNPFDAPALFPWQSTMARRVYNGMHSGVEFVVKNVTEELIAAELWNNTILVLCGDNVSCDSCAV